MKILKRVFISSGILTLSLAILIVFIASALIGFYVGSGKDYRVDYVFFKEYLQDKQPSVMVGDVNPVPHDEAYNFVLTDKTNENEYKEGYNCVDFALELWRNAAWAGIECKLIGLDLDHGRYHMIVGFPNEDGLLLLVDPKTDAIMKPVMGKQGFSNIWGISFIEAPLEVYSGN